eukprot:g8649.t1
MGVVPMVLYFWFGTCRLHTPFLVLWLLGLAGAGEWSLTYKMLTTYTGNVLAEKLSPFAYPMYLTHYNVAWYYWFLTRGGYNAREWWWNDAAGHPWPVEAPLETALVILLSLVAAWFLNKVSERFAFLGIKCMECQCAFCGLGCWVFLCGEAADCCPETLIREMSGAVVSRDSLLDEVGLDSFGVAAFAGALRHRLRGNKRAGVPSERIETSAVAKCRSVNDLVRYLVGLGVGERDAARGRGFGGGE